MFRFPCSFSRLAIRPSNPIFVLVLILLLFVLFSQFDSRNPKLCNTCGCHTCNMCPPGTLQRRLPTKSKILSLESCSRKAKRWTQHSQCFQALSPPSVRASFADPSSYLEVPRYAANPEKVIYRKQWFLLYGPRWHRHTLTTDYLRSKLPKIDIILLAPLLCTGSPHRLRGRVLPIPLSTGSHWTYRMTPNLDLHSITSSSTSIHSYSPWAPL